MDINSQRKKVFQIIHSVTGIVLVLALCILHGGYLFESTQVGQNTSFFYGKNVQAEACGSTSLERIPSTPNILEEKVFIHRIRGQVYALNINQSGYTGGNTSQKQNIRVAIIGKMVTFRDKIYLGFFSFTDKVISNDMDSRIDKTDRYLTNMGIARWHLMDLGTGK